MDAEDVLARLFVADLADGLDEGLALDVADGAADFADHDLAPASSATARMRDLISFVRWGTAWMVPPR